MMGGWVDAKTFPCDRDDYWTRVSAPELPLFLKWLP